MTDVATTPSAIGLRTLIFAVLILIGQPLCVCDSGCMADEISQADTASLAPAPPLHQLINQRLGKLSGLSTGLCSDAEFLRRVSLDLNGMPPRADEARAFMADTTPDKRTRLIDRLMQSPLFDRHLATSLDVMLMERRPNTNIPQDEWLGWLIRCVRENRPWNSVAKEILSADGDDPATRVAARFCLDRAAEPNVIARDIGRIFFGRDLQCAQCHDSPLVSDYLQADYHGLLAFTSTGYAVTKKMNEKDTVVYAERAASDLSFESVFIKGTMHRTGARIPGSTLLEEPFFLPGDEYSVAPADAVRSVPKFSRRAFLAEQATNGSNDLFNQNIANRMWALMLGRGLVHPLDMIHPDNPPVDAELLRELAERFAAMNFDLRTLIRELALTDIYQRPFDLTPVLTELSGQVVTRVTELTQQVDALNPAAAAAATTYDTAASAYDAAEAAWLPVAIELDAARNKYAEAKKKVAEAEKAAADAQTVLAARKAISDAVQLAASTTKQSTDILTDDAELKSVADKLAARSGQLTAEVATLQAAAEEKLKAVTAPKEALAAIVPEVDTAVQKLQPVTAALRQTDQSKVDARRPMQQTQSDANSLRTQLKTAQLVASLPELTSTLTVSQTVLPERQAALAAVTQQTAQFAPVVAERQSQLSAAESAVTTATTAVTTSRQTLDQQNAAVANLTEALAAITSAQEKMSADTELADSATKLNSRLEVIRTASVASKQLADNATKVAAEANSAFESSRKSMDEAAAEMRRLQQSVSETQAALDAAQASLTASRQKLDDAVTAAGSSLSDQFALSPLKALTPEQMCWSVFRVTAVYDNYIAAEIAELDKTAPLTDEQKADPTALKAREQDVEQKVYDKLKQYIATYVQYYGGGPGQPQGEFYASADQALHSANGGAINSWCVPSGDNVAARIVNQTDPRLCAEELYLAILTRLPTDDEMADVSARLQSRTDRNLVAQELVWGLLNGAEFRFNH